MAISNVNGATAVTPMIAPGGSGDAQTSMGSVQQVNAMSTGDFASKMAGASNKDLTTALGTAGLSDARKSEIATELLNRLDAAKTAAAPHAAAAEKAPAEETDEEKKIKDLLKKLKDGTITAAEMKELMGMLAKDKAAQDTKPGGADKTENSI